MRYEKRRNIVVSLTHCSIPNMMNVPPSIMNPAGKMALTPQIDKYFPTRGPEDLTKTLSTKMSVTCKLLPNIKSER